MANLNVSDTSSIDVSVGSDGTFTADLIVDPAAGNALTVGPNGVFVAGGAGGGVDANTQNAWAGSGTVSDPFVITDPDGNVLATFVSAGVDTDAQNSWSGTGSATDPWVITDPDGNVLASVTNGGVDTDTQNSWSGSGTVADPYIITDADGNVLATITDEDIDVDAQNGWSGTGTLADPYLITDPDGNVIATVVNGGVDTDTQNSWSGTGTDVDPWVITDPDGNAIATVTNGTPDTDTQNAWSGDGTVGDPFVVTDPDGNVLATFGVDTVTTSTITKDPAKLGYAIHSNGATPAVLTELFCGYPVLSDPGGLNGTAPTAPEPFIWIDDSVSPACVMFWNCDANGGAGAFTSTPGVWTINDDGNWDLNGAEYLDAAGLPVIADGCKALALCPGTSIIHEIPAACNDDLTAFLAQCLRDAGEIA